MNYMLGKAISDFPPLLMSNLCFCGNGYNWLPLKRKPVFCTDVVVINVILRTLKR